MFFLNLFMRETVEVSDVYLSSTFTDKHVIQTEKTFLFETDKMSFCHLECFWHFHKKLWQVSFLERLYLCSCSLWFRSCRHFHFFIKSEFLLQNKGEVEEVNIMYVCINVFLLLWLSHPHVFKFSLFVQFKIV